MSSPTINPLPMQSRAAAILTACFFVVGMAWFSRGLDFPPYYHPDEINKVDQLQQHSRNFNHPQLMLNSAAVIYWAIGSPMDNLKTAAATRWVSVFFAATAVALLAQTAWLLGGLVAQICCGVLLLATPKLFELTHYLKEDPALIMGFAAIYLTMVLYQRKPNGARALWLGIAAGLAISAKYIGILPALVALIALVSLNWKDRNCVRHAALFLGACLVVLAVTNWQAIMQAGQFGHGLGHEVGLFQEKEKSLLNSEIIGMEVKIFGILGWLAALAWLLSPFYRRKLNAAEWVIFAATFGYALILLASSRTASRYLLPVEVSLPLMISVAACWLGAAVAERCRIRPIIVQAIAGVALLVNAGAQDTAELRELYAGFHSDTHLQLAEFVRITLPPTAVIAEDVQVRLPIESNRRRSVEGWNQPQRRVYPASHPHLADEYSVADLRKRGVTHVAIQVDNDTSAALRGKGKLDAEQEKIGTFLADLEANSQLVWSCKSQSPAYLNPALRFYELTAPH